MCIYCTDTFNIWYIHIDCTTMPKGWSHVVYLAQQVHEHILYRNNINILRHYTMLWHNCSLIFSCALHLNQ